MATEVKQTTRAQESTNAIERLYITMRHLLNRGFYKPSGVSGNALRSALLLLRPEIYGTIAEDKAELNGLIYVLERLPEGIEECRFINLTSDEGFAKSHLKAIVPPKRRRNCSLKNMGRWNHQIPFAAFQNARLSHNGDRIHIKEYFFIPFFQRL